MDWLPDDAVAEIGVDNMCSPALLPELPQQQRWLIVYRKLDFGWKFCNALVRRNLDFPHWLPKEDRLLHKAWLWLQNPTLYNRDEVEHAVMLRQPCMAESKALVEGLLMSGDVSLKDISSKCGISQEALRMYSLLFFCATDRKKDAFFMQHVLYPRGRLPELLDKYLENSNWSNLLMRLGYNKGSSHVGFLSGLDRDELVEQLAVAGTARRFEALTLAQGLLLNELGLFNQSRNTSAMGSASKLITAGKLGGNVEEDEQPLGPYTQALGEEIRMVGRREFEDTARKTIGRTFTSVEIEDVSE